MITYIPYTPGIDVVDLVPDAGRYIPAEVAELERAREALLTRRENGTYTAEIQNAVAKVEEALNFLLHFRTRRSLEGIYTIDFPEVDTGKADLLYTLGAVDTRIKFLKDSAEGPVDVLDVAVSDTPPKYVLGLLSALQEARCKLEFGVTKNMHHIIEIDNSNEENVKVTIKVLVDRDSLNSEDDDVVHELNIARYLDKTARYGAEANQLAEAETERKLRFVCLSTGQIREYTIPKDIVNTPYYNNSSFYSVIGDYIREATGVLPFGNGDYPFCIFHILDMDDEAYATLVEKANAIVARIIESIKGNQPQS